MNRLALPALAAVALACAAAFVAPAWSQDQGADPAETMKKIQRYTTPGAQHERLAPWVGTFDTTTKVFMAPGAPPMQSKGEIAGAWVLGKRFVEMRGKGTMLGMPLETVSYMGYDSFKQRFTYTAMNTLSTSQDHALGNFDHAPGAPTLHLYGTIDEYLDGTHDKPVRYTMRVTDADTIVLEVHDLDIGEKNTLVVEMTMKRRK